MKKNSIWWAIASSVLIAGAQLCFKLTMSSKGLNDSIINWFFFIGIIAYGLAAVLFMVSLKNGVLSKTFPAISLSLIWIYLLSYLILNEKITPINLIGAGILLFGNFIIFKK